MIAYSEAAPPKVADKKNLWSVPSGLSRQFLEQEETVVAAESAEPISCNRCAEEGQTGACESCRGAKTAPCEALLRAAAANPAKSCGGNGVLSCAQCAGSGKVTLSVAAIGMPVVDVCPGVHRAEQSPRRDCADAVSSDCAACANKRVVACPAGEGRGTAPWPAAGARKVVRGFSVAIAYKLAYYRRPLCAIRRSPRRRFPRIPRGASSGKRCSSARFRTPPRSPGTQAGRTGRDAFLRRSSRSFRRLASARIPSWCYLALTVEKIPIYEVAYSFGAARSSHARTTRFENRVSH